MPCPLRHFAFRAPIEINGINPYVRVRAGQAARLKAGWRKPMPVKIRVNGEPTVGWRINMMPAGDGSFFLYLHERVRKASGTKVGDVVSVTIEFDEAYRGGPMPIRCRDGSALSCGGTPPRERAGRPCRPADRRKSCVTSRA